MNKMKAYVRTNSTSTLVELTEVPIPKIEANEVLIEVKAFGVGIHDRYFIPQNPEFPYPIGTEGAGIITELGNDVTDFKVGDRVILSSSLHPIGGSWAEYAAVSGNSTFRMPNEMEFSQGAAIPVAGKTAVESLHALDLKAGDTLFIAGASGAIGTFVIQLAKSKGIRVIGSASTENHDYMKLLGAEKAVDYKSIEWKNEVKQWMPGGVDAALAIQPGTAKDSMDVVKDGGKVITVSGDKVDAERKITVQQFLHQLDIGHVINSLVEENTTGKLEIMIEQIYPFTEAIHALEKTETRHAKGKIVVSQP